MQVERVIAHVDDGTDGIDGAEGAGGGKDGGGKDGGDAGGGGQGGGSEGEDDAMDADELDAASDGGGAASEVGGPLAGTGGRGQYLVKWAGLTYDLCTWESAKTAGEAAVRAYHARESAMDDRVAAAAVGGGGGGEPSASSSSSAAARDLSTLPDEVMETRRELRDYQLDGLRWLRHNYAQVEASHGMEPSEPRARAPGESPEGEPRGRAPRESPEGEPRGRAPSESPE